MRRTLSLSLSLLLTVIAVPLSATPSPALRANGRPFVVAIGGDLSVGLHASTPVGGYVPRVAELVGASDENTYGYVHIRAMTPEQALRRLRDYPVPATVAIIQLEPTADDAPATWSADVVAVVRETRATYPHAHLVVLLPLGDWPEHTTALAAAAVEAGAVVIATRNIIQACAATCISTADDASAFGPHFQGDGVMPNDAGHQALAEAIAAALQTHHVHLPWTENE